MLSYEQATELGFELGMQWTFLGFKNFFWKIEFRWKRNRLLFGSKWNTFARDCNLTIGDKLVLVSTEEEERFEVAIFEKERYNAVYKSGKLVLKILSLTYAMQQKWFYSFVLKMFYPIFENYQVLWMVRVI